MSTPGWRTGFLLLLLLLPGRLVAQEVYEHAESGYRFPASLGVFSRKEVHRFSDRRLGVSVAYVARGMGLLDFYVYDLGLSPIPDGPDSDRARTAFVSAVRDVREAVRRGYYSHLAVTSEPGQTMQPRPGMPRFQVVTYAYTVDAANAERVVSWLLVTGARNHFLKIRYTCPASKAAEAERAVKALLVAFFEANWDRGTVRPGG